MMKRALLPFVFLIAVSCSKGSSPTEPAVSMGKLVTTVTESTAGVANATIEVRQTQDGAVVASAMTNGSGVSELPLPTGSYWVRVIPPSGYAFVTVSPDLTRGPVPVGQSGAEIRVVLAKM
jgi:hypothetical protein